MGSSALNRDILADAKLGLQEWGAAIRGLRENPVLLIGQRNLNPRPKDSGGAARRRRAIAQSWVTWCGWLAALLIGAITLLKHLLPLGTASTLLGLALGAIAFYSIWAGSGLFQTCLFVLSLLAPVESRPVQTSWLDETMQGSPISDREMLLGILALALPRIWLRWCLGPAALIAGIAIMAQQPAAAEGANDFHNLLRDHPGIVPSLLKISPLTILLLLGLGWISSLIMLLWLISLGRSEMHGWRRQMVAFVISVAQPLGTAVALWHLSTWASFTSPLDPNWYISYLVPFIALALFCASVHFGRYTSELRTGFATLSPLLLIGLGTVGGFVTSSPEWSSLRLINLYAWVNESVWIFSWLALVNPMAIPNAVLLGMDPAMNFTYRVFDPMRFPALLALQLIALAISAHSARLAVFDWRHSEE